MTPVRFVPLTQTGQVVPVGIGETPAERQRLLDQLGTAFREITPALILTGIAIGIASGLGSTLGTAIGTIVVERFITPQPAQRRRR